MIARSSAAAQAPPTVRVLLTEATTAIGRSRAIEHWQASLARYDAEELMAAALGTPLTTALQRTTPDAAQRRRYAAMVERRISGEPVAQIIGHFMFRGLKLHMRRGVFGPRISSELLAGEAISALRRRRASRIAVDVATGSGPVALAIAAEVKGAEVWGVDISREAVDLGRDNARRLGIGNVKFRAGDMLEALPLVLQERIDVFTIHPPYVARKEIRILPKEIRDYEPVHSLTDGSNDGLGLVRRLAAESHVWLRPGGLLLVEIGTYLSRQAQSTLRRAGLVDVAWTRDELGVTRVVSGRRPR